MYKYVMNVLCFVYDTSLMNECIHTYLSDFVTFKILQNGIQ